MARRLNEEQATVNTGILNISFSLGCKFLSEVCRVLIFNVLDNWIPASIIVDLISIAWGIDNVESQLYAVLLDDVGNGLNFGGRSYWLIWGESSLGIDQM